jgi:hypothetical protein
MDPAVATGAPGGASNVFRDGLGERRRATDSTGTEVVERLCLRSDLTKVPAFEFALRERASRLASFRHPCFATIRSIDRLNDATSTLAVVSDAVRGVRLSALLAKSDRATIDINAAVHLIRQLVSAVAVLHETAPDVAHGAIAAERIVVTPNARVVVVEHVLGAALEQLHYSRDRYWAELRVALPASTIPHLDQRTDVVQIGVVSLSLIVGRLLESNEYPTLIGDVLSSARAISAHGDREALPAGLRTWLARALQLDSRASFQTALDARTELERMLTDEDESVEDVIVDEPAAKPVETAAAKPAPTPPIVVEPVVKAPPAAVPPPASSPVASTAPPPAPPKPASAAPVAKAPIVTPPPVSKPSVDPSLEALDSLEPLDLDDPWTAPVDPEPIVSSGAREILKSKQPLALVAGIAVVILATGGYAAKRYVFAGGPKVVNGSVSLTTVPPGAQVVVDGQARGVTPVTLALAPGQHALELRGNGGEPRTIPITIGPGQQISQYVELKSVASVGQLQVRSEPTGALVTVDGVERGKAPLVIDALTPGEHAVVLQSDIATVKQTVSIEAGQTASLVVPLGGGDGAPVPGWITVTAPVELQLFENKKLLGSSQSDRIMVMAGRHEIELINEPLGYRVVRTVQVPAGKVAPLSAPNWPTGSVALNALPWAEVFVDDKKIGETPIGNIALPIGPHEVLFRHPDLGEQRQGITVSLKSPVRVSVDLRKKP